MPIGTPILAAREGMVIDVVDINTKRCDSLDCAKFNNYVKIYHPDGSIAEYHHIKFKSALVKKGDSIAKGQAIALSGNVGFSSTPHLHFQVHKDDMNKRQTLDTKFLIKKGESLEILKKGKTYKKEYE